MLTKTVVGKQIGEYDIKPFLPYVDSSLRESLTHQFERVSELMQARENKGFTVWDVRAAKYARNLRQTRSFLYAGLEDYAIAKDNGGKNATARMSTLMETIILPSLLADLHHPSFHPIDTRAYPNDWCTDTSTGRTSNEHILDGALVWLEWDYQMEEPSFWCAEILEPFFGFGSSAISPMEAVKIALKDVARNRHQQEAWLNKPYSLDELSTMHNREVRRIAEYRNIQGSHTKRIVELRSLISQPQGNLLHEFK